MKKHLRKIIFVISSALGIVLILFIWRIATERQMMEKIISRLEASSRIAQVLVTNVRFDEETRRLHTTIKFLEHDTEGNPLEPKYFTFAGNIIQFQSLVIRFDDIHIRNADKLKSRSAYLFWKVFMLDGSNTEEYEITHFNQVPDGYNIKGISSSFERGLWRRFWKYALDSEESRSMGVKNAQIEAPGTMFIPGILYTIHIEHDGGVRIDSAPIPNILKGESLPT